MSASRAMGTLRGFCKARALDLDMYLEALGERNITADDVDRIKKLRDALEAQFERTHTKWESLVSDEKDPFKDEEEHVKCKADYDESKIILDKALKVAKNVLDKAQTTGTSQETVATAHCFLLA